MAECDKPTNDVNMAHVRMLLKETFPSRRRWISSMPDGGVKAIIAKYPAFEYGKFVSTPLL
jgi:hypothetical protein